MLDEHILCIYLQAHQLKSNGWAPVGLREKGDTLENCLRLRFYIEITLKYEILSVHAVILHT